MTKNVEQKHKMEKDERLVNLRETELLTWTISKFLGKRVGFIAKYVPQFDTSDSSPISLKENISLLSEAQFNTIIIAVNREELSPKKSVATFTERLGTIYTSSSKIVLKGDIIIGYVILFSPEYIDKSAVKSLIEYFEDVIALRKKAQAIEHITVFSKSLPRLKSPNFYRFIGDRINSALSCAETLILAHSKKDPRIFTTVYSSRGSSIDVPSGNNFLHYCMREKKAIIDNDLDDRSGNSYEIHNKHFFKINEYKSLIGAAIIPDNPENTFVVLCIFRRAFAISKVEEELFQAICLSLEGLCAREIALQTEENSVPSDYNYRLMLNCLLIADVMHDAAEDMIVARNNLVVARTRNEDDESKLIETKRILNELIHASVGFKISVSGNKNRMKADYSKYNLNKMVADVIDKYAGNVNGVHFYNDVSSNIEVKLIRYMVKRALDNALKNSVRHVLDVTHRRKEIRVRAHKMPGQIMLEIIDNGLGMDHETRSRATELGFSTVGGMGHGMSIIKAAALAHEGRIEIDSDPGKSCSIKMFFTHSE